jgi:hypothetical protein
MKRFLILLMGFIFLDCSQTQTIQVSKEIEEFYSSYNKAWSNADLNFISEEIYAVPFTLYLNDTTMMFFTKDEVKSFLQTTFDDLEANNYGYSIRNNWENYQSKNDIIIIEQNFTRFLTDSTVMNPKERTASYILRKQNNKYKIIALIPHSPVGSK